jgi:hypothetical protein
MEILITRDGQQFGPYTLDDVNAYLASGELNADDMAWHDGMADWLPLRSIEGVVAPRISAPPPPSARTGRGNSLVAPDEVSSVARTKKLWLACLVGLLAIGFLIGLTDAAAPVLAVGLCLLAIPVAIAFYVYAYKLAKGIGSPVPWLYCLLMLVPVVQLITMLVLERKATAFLKGKGHKRA